MRGFRRGSFAQHVWKLRALVLGVGFNGSNRELNLRGRMMLFEILGSLLLLTLQSKIEIPIP